MTILMITRLIDIRIAVIILEPNSSRPHLSTRLLRTPQMTVSGLREMYLTIYILKFRYLLINYTLKKLKEMETFQILDKLHRE